MLSDGLSYAKGPSATLIEATIGEMLQRIAGRFPDRDALVVPFQDIRWTWRELDEHVTHTARGLAGLGLAPGDRVGIWSSNCVEWILLQLATARAGYVLVSVNPAYRSNELRFALQKSRMKAIFLRESDTRSNYRDILEEAAAGQSLPLAHTVFLHTPDWTDMLARGSDLPGHPIANTDPVNIQYTSGTTGTPKGALLTHRGLLNNGWLTGEWLHLTERDRLVCPFPLYHCAGCVCCALNCLTHGAALILSSPQFDPAAALDTIEAERATVIGGVPTMFIAMLEELHRKSRRIDSLRMAMMGGAPCPVELLKRVQSEMHCQDVSVIYGQTEASPVLTMSAPGDTPEQRTSTVGRVLPETEVKIVAIGGDEAVAVGEQGELCARAFGVMPGYDAEPEATGRTIDSNGWLHTGDLATMREDGCFCITGRLKDMIIRGGENVYPREIEEFLYAHPKVSDVQVVGVPDARLGEAVAAWVRAKPGENLTEEELRAFCKDRIAHFKIPQYFRFVESYPMTVTGKIQKFRIREMETADRGLNAGAAKS